MNDNFIITNTILSIKDEFTMEDVIEKLQKYSINDINLIKKSIIRLRENDYLEENGSYYRVLTNDESKRWGFF